MTVDSNLGAVVGAEEGAIGSIPGNEGRIAQAWVNVRGGLRIFWHSEGWTPRNEAVLEAVLKQANTTRHPRLVAFDANMRPEGFEKSFRFRKERMQVVAPLEVSTCRSKGPQGEWIEKTYDYVTKRVIASEETFHRWRWLKTLSRRRTTQCPFWSKEKRRYRCSLATVEEGC